MILLKDLLWRVLIVATNLMTYCYFLILKLSPNINYIFLPIKFKRIRKLRNSESLNVCYFKFKWTFNYFCNYNFFFQWKLLQFTVIFITTTMTCVLNFIVVFRSNKHKFLENRQTITNFSLHI